MQADRVVVAYDSGFELDRTIFASVESKLNRIILKDKLASQAFWSDAAQARVRAAFAAKYGPVPRSVGRRFQG